MVASTLARVAPGPRWGRVGGRLMVLGSEAAWSLVEGQVEPLRYRHPRAQARALRAIARRLCNTHGVFASIRGSFPDTTGILVANHLSYIDPLVLAGLLPLAPIAKAEVRSWPFVGEAMRNLGVIFIRRGDAMSGAIALRRAITALRAGVCVLNFPEGTTTSGDHVRSLHLGAFGLARLCDVPIVPVGIRLDAEHCWVGDTAFLPHYLKTCARSHTLARLHLGAPLYASRFVSDRHFAHAVRSELFELSQSA